VGAREEERIDVFPNPNPKAPILIFVHGGWWLKTTRKHWSYTAYGFVQHGYTVIVSDYTLCPKGRIPDITQANRAAVAWAYEHADEINGDRDRIYLAGHSAGGQQAGMMAVTDWVQHGLPADVLKAVVPLSGIFDMRVIQHSYLNGFVQLNGESVQTQSAILHIPDSAPPIQLMVAEEESTEFHRQAEEFLEAWKAKKLDGSLVIIPDEDHSTYIFEMGHPDSPTCNAVVDFFKKH
jgi:arylformamidase